MPRPGASALARLGVDKCPPTRTVFLSAVDGVAARLGRLIKSWIAKSEVCYRR
jgi:hypothetical protein